MKRFDVSSTLIPDVGPLARKVESYSIVYVVSGTFAAFSCAKILGLSKPVPDSIEPMFFTYLCVNNVLVLSVV